jgi:seryl-tRNA synthetase
LGDNVSRLHRGLRAVGTALVSNPAGSNTGFHGGQFFLVAEEENYKETDMTEAEVKALQDALALAEAKTAELEASVSSYEQKVADMEAAVKTAQDELEAKSAELAKAVGKYETYTLRAPALIRAGVEVNTLPITDWDEATYDAFVTRAGQPKQTRQMVVADSDDNPKMTWEHIFGGKA